jgi:hypothetical protein
MNKVTEGIKKCLKIRMDMIFKQYEERDSYPYELYTLMCTIADEFDINYTMELHGELMGV